MILSNVTNFEPGESRRRFEQGRREAQEKERELLRRLRATPDGESKAAETKAMIDRVRTFMGYREYPKYHMVSRYFVYKQALLQEAERLVRAHVLRSDRGHLLPAVRGVAGGRAHESCRRPAHRAAQGRHDVVSSS